MATQYTYTAIINSTFSLGFTVGGQQQLISKAAPNTAGCTVYISNSDGTVNASGNYVTVVDNTGELYTAAYNSLTQPSTGITSPQALVNYINALLQEVVINGGGGGGGGVNTWNTRTGNVVMTASDINTTLGLGASNLVGTDGSGNLTNGVGALGFIDTNVLGGVQSSANSYNQIIIQNTSNGTTASSDFIVTNNNSTATTFYGDFGINSSGFTGSSSFNLANAVFLTATSGDLAIGTTTNNIIRFLTNSSSTDAVQISNGGAVGSANLFGINAVLTTSGSTSPNTYQAYNKFQIAHTATSALTNNTNGLIGIYGSINVTGASGTTSQSNTFLSEFILNSAAAIVTAHNGLHIIDASVSGGGSLTTHNGILFDDLTAASNNNGIKSLISSGSNKYFINHSGTAVSYFGGYVGVGVSSPAATAWLQLGANSTSVAGINFAGGGSLNTTPLGGSVEYDGNSLYYTGSGITRGSISRVMFTQTATTTVTNITSPTSIMGTGVGTTTLAANTLVVGRAIRFKMDGYIKAASNPNLNILVYLNSTVIATNANTSITSIGSPGTQTKFSIEFIFTCYSTGSGGTIWTQGGFGYNTAPQGLAYQQMVNTNPTTINTTIAQTIDVKLVWGIASTNDSLTSTSTIIEILN